MQTVNATSEHRKSEWVAILGEKFMKVELSGMKGRS
jgi:hypothetical protein